jgi:MFS family permease
MDHVGGVLGPVFSILFLWAFPGAIRELFLVTLIPGLIALFMVILAPTPQRSLTLTQKPTHHSPTRISPKLKRYLFIVGVFAFANASDAFLLLRFSELGASAMQVSMLWMGQHAVMALTSSMGGVFSDQRGRRVSILLGWSVFVVSYLGMAHAPSAAVFVVFFLFYGLFSSFTESAEKALVAEEAALETRGRAYGVLHLVNGIMLLPASLTAGWVAQTWSLSIAMQVCAVVALVAALLLAFELRRKITVR